MALKHSKKKKLVVRPEGEFKKLAKSIVKGYADEGDFPIEHLFFRKMNSKWGSCSNKKNLTLNTLMKYLPQDIIKYIIYHELVHLREKRHNSSFWKAISSEFPDYERKEKELFAYWFKIQKTVMK